MRDKILNIINKNPDKLFVSDEKKSYINKDILSLSLKIEEKFNNELIGLYFDKSSDYILSVLALTLSSNSFIPLSVKLPLERLNYVINDSNIQTIITTKKKYDSIHHLNVKNVFFIEDLMDLELLNDKEFLVKEKKEQYRIYTSGSTGKPKGVIIGSEKGVCNVIEQQINILNLNKENVFLYLSINFDASLSDIYCSFLSESILFINDEILLKPKSLIEYFNKNNITYSDLPPSILKLFKPKDFKSFNKMIIGGELPDKDTVMSYVNNGFKVLNVYGPTEVSICTSMILCNKEWSSKNIGKPLDNIKYKIIESELYISGIGLAVSYTSEMLTKERFVYIDGERFFKTGDVVSFENEFYIFKGRKDRQIKHNGQLICLEEIEESVKSINEVINSAVVYHNKKIFLFYEGKLDSNLLLEMLKLKLPSYMIPQYIRNQLIPKNSNGKNDNNQLLKLIG